MEAFRIGDKVFVSSIWDCFIERMSRQHRPGCVRITFPGWPKSYNMDVPYGTILDQRNNRVFQTIDDVQIDGTFPVRVHLEDPAEIIETDSKADSNGAEMMIYLVRYTGKYKGVSQKVSGKRVRAIPDSSFEDSFSPDANSTELNESWPLLQCVICGSVFLTSEQLEKHSLGDHHYCPYCDVHIARKHSCPHVQLPSIKYR